MWSLRQKTDSSFYLTYDRDRWFNNRLPGIWELVGPKDSPETRHCVEINKRAGLLTADDDQGNSRVLVLEDRQS